MSKSDTFENEWLLLIFNTTAITNVAQNGTSPLTNLQLGLHTGDPGESGLENTSETSYGSYARKAVARSSSGFSISGNVCSLVANAAFIAATTGAGTVLNFFHVGTTATGTGKLLYSGGISPTITVAVGAQPTLTAASIITED
jgi:hypothetical protein